ncbi:PREDICTED: vacuolar protein sorting-associated protein 8 homolog isoform X2 [Priapulus caudatus]|uniref:Vacuolar protein sorting-associated protein 8 homolog isoform X2 n=1 Tax=Priapulus caudatus TaxID=37621 RepID=A0ABM1EUE7_PRICU|nr:PREDICTED: vacuolar protein sorting-associated protein 8 homolog isoform X2 [Priapulus caudatus]
MDSMQAPQAFSAENVNEDSNGESQHDDALSLDIIEIDDTEFDLPCVASPPTLESIMNEPDDLPGVEEDGMFHDQGETASVTSDLASGLHTESSSDRSTPNRNIRQRNIQYPVHGSVLRHVILRGISSQMLSAGDRVNAGAPSAMAVSALVAIGTTHGLVLVFDPQQVLKWCLGNVTSSGDLYGSVSALGMNSDCSRLLVGHAKGQITMWDLVAGKLLRVITDAHPPGSAVLHLQFTDDHTVAVFSDSGGSVFELNFKRLMGVRSSDSTCIFSGSRGEVCCIVPLHGGLLQDHVLDDLSIVALATLSKVIVITIRPKLRVLFHHPLKGDVSTLPLVVWHYVVIQQGGKRSLEPVLAFGRGNNIYFYQKMVMSYVLLGLMWVNAKTMLALDTMERLHVIDIRREEELEMLDIGDVKLVYGSSHFKSLATGGNVSPAMAIAGENACYQSVALFRGQVLMLGTKSVHVFNIRTWFERIDFLVRQDKHQEALALTLSFYDDKARAVVGLTRNVTRMKEQVSKKLLSVLYQYEVSVMKNVPERGPVLLLTEHYQQVIPVCIDCCLAINRTDVLFDEIYDRISRDGIAKMVFLECLEPYIIADRLRQVAPAVMQDLVENCQRKDRIADLEHIIVHLDIMSMDIDHIVKLCWKHSLYDGIIYIFNQGMRDYISPLEELLSILNDLLLSKKEVTDSIVRLGNKILVYLSCCLAGRAYPAGDIPEFMVLQVKTTVLKTLTVLHTGKPPEDEPLYPYLRTLLHYNTREFLNALALAFEEPEYKSENGQQQKQRIVDILLQIMVDNIEFSPTQVGALFTFLARQMAREGSTIYVSRMLFEQVLEYLSNSTDESRHEEREQALLELLHAAGLQQFDEHRLLLLAETAHFYRVCELLYDKSRQYDKVLHCYLKDDSRQHQAFNFVEHVVTSVAAYKAAERDRVQEEALQNFEAFVSIDHRRAAQLLATVFPQQLMNVLVQLSSSEKLEYLFLQGLVEYRESQAIGIMSKDKLNIGEDVQEKYIELMCKYSPGDVCSYIKSSEGFTIENTLKIVQRHQIMDAAAYLLEKSGDVQAAFNMLLKNLQDKVDALSKVLLSEHESQTTDVSVSWTGLQVALLVVIQLCQRTSGKMEEVQRQALWFPILDTMMIPQRHLKNQVDPEQLDSFKDLTRHVLNSMMGYISVAAILQRIMEDPAYNTGKLGEIKELVLGMLNTFRYEKTLLRATNNLLNQDLHGQLSRLQRTANRAYVTNSDCCALCHKPLANIADADMVVLFRCTHSYHTPCLKSMGSFSLVQGDELWECWHCSSNAMKQLPTTRGRIRSPSTQLADVVPSRGKNAPDSQQLQALEHLRKAQKTVSRLAILSELANPNRQPKVQHSQITQGSSILQREDFQLKLAPPHVEN